MSHRVEPADLADVAARYGRTPFLMYASADGSARVNHVVVDSIDTGPAGTTARCRGHGRGVAGRVAAGAPLSLLWPAPSEGEFSLIADGAGTIDGDALTITVSGAVLHRPAPLDGDTSC